LFGRIASSIRDFFESRGRSRIEREIQSIIDVGEEKGLIDSESGEMIQSILDFKKTVVREIMIPRTEIVALKSDATIEDILNLITEYGHTRMPVYDVSVDNIIGIFNVKDLLKFWLKPVTVRDLISTLRRPYYIPETKKTALLLQELKQKKYHMAIVIDEYGGTSGLVTLEDLVEEIIGEIHDEYDAREFGIIDLQNGYTLVDSRIGIEELERFLDVRFSEGKYETLSGLILNVIKRIPVTGEIIKINNYEMVIDSADERSIKKVKIKKSEKNQSE
jgi:CBS domain containing-hemolysin-like protein